jgi:hypothetical protein
LNLTNMSYEIDGTTVHNPMLRDHPLMSSMAFQSSHRLHVEYWPGHGRKAPPITTQCTHEWQTADGPPDWTDCADYRYKFLLVKSDRLEMNFTLAVW